MWMPHPLYELYEASEHSGQIRSFNNKYGPRLSPHILKLTPDSTGYLTMKVRHGGRSISYQAHVFIAECWHGLGKKGLQVRHLDGNYLNNDSDNLKWGTARENNMDSVRHGRVKTIFTEKDVRTIRCLRKKGLSEARIARKTGFKESSVGNVLNGRSWAWLK